MSAGGYIFLHDHNGTGYNDGPARATREFFADKPEKIIDIPDQWGSIMIRKINESTGLTASDTRGKRDHPTAMSRIRRLLQTPFVRARNRLFVR
jgi:hypothetical protein